MTVFNIEKSESETEVELELERPDLSRRQDEDSLSHYIRKVNSLKILSAKEELKLVNAWIKNQDQKAADKLLEAHMKLVVKIASQYKGYGLPVEDLIAEGSVGLMKSLKNFKPEMGNRFSTYAMWWIKAEIKEYVLHNWSMVKMGTTRAQKRLFFSLRSMRRKIQEEKGSFGAITDAEMGEIAEKLMVSKKAVKNMDSRMGNRDFSLNATFSDGEGEESEWQDTLADDGPTQEEVCIDDDMKSKRRLLLERAMSNLSERESQIIHQRRLTDQPVTLETLGELYGLSRERIRQIESAAFEKLQANIIKSAQTVGMSV